VKVVASTATPEAFGRRAASGLARNDTLVTATTTEAHNLIAGDEVTISGADQALYNGTHKVTSVPTATTFTYVIVLPRETSQHPVSPATGTIVCDCQIFFRRCTVQGKNAVRTDNATTVYLGNLSTNDTQPFEVAAGEDVEIPVPVGCRQSLVDWYVDVGTNGDGVVLLFS